MSELINKVVGKRFRIIVEPLTPVHVWSGDDIIIGVDCIYMDDKLCIIDYDKLPMEIINELMGVSTTEWPRILSKYAGKVPCKTIIDALVKPPVGSRVKLINKYIIPGTSIKGYIRTAIAFFKVSSMSSRDARSILRSNIDLTKPPKEASIGLEAVLFRAPRHAKVKGFVDMFQSIHVSDPIVHRTTIKLLEFLVMEPGKEGLNIIARNNVIAFTSGKLEYIVNITIPVEFNRIVKPAPEHRRDVEKLMEPINIDLFEVLRTFGCHILRYEFNRVARIPELSKYRSMLGEWLKTYCSEGTTQCTIARLGFMTGHQAKTLLTTVKSVDPELYSAVVNTMSRVVRRVWDERTLKLVMLDRDLVGVGWCRVCVERA